MFDGAKMLGWCLEWVHPTPRGFNVREREGERETSKRERREEAFSSYSIRGLNSAIRVRYIRVLTPPSIHTHNSLTPFPIYPRAHTCACAHTITHILTLTFTLTLVHICTYTTTKL